jgi:hypothetical protein
MRSVLDDDVGRLHGRVSLEVGADEAAVPCPVVLGVACRVDAGVPAARADVTLERFLLNVVENIARRQKENDGSVPRERRVGET